MFRKVLHQKMVPSAGITMLTSLVSLFTQKRVKSKLAMTGENHFKGKGFTCWRD